MTQQNNQALHWYEYAKQDLHTAEVLLKAEIYAQVCFHAQQVIEKLLKAYLIQSNTKPPRIHSIKELIKLCQDHENIVAMDIKALIIDAYYIPTRYPDSVIGNFEDSIPSVEDAEEALEIAKDFFEIFREDFKTKNVEDTKWKKY